MAGVNLRSHDCPALEDVPHPRIGFGGDRGQQRQVMTELAARQNLGAFKKGAEQRNREAGRMDERVCVTIDHFTRHS